MPCAHHVATGYDRFYPDSERTDSGQDWASAGGRFAPLLYKGNMRLVLQLRPLAIVCQSTADLQEMLGLTVYDHASEAAGAPCAQARLLFPALDR